MDELEQAIVAELSNQAEQHGAFISELPNEPTIRYDGLIHIDCLAKAIKQNLELRWTAASDLMPIDNRLYLAKHHNGNILLVYFDEFEERWSETLGGFRYQSVKIDDMVAFADTGEGYT